jgi:hypothetical protein
MVGRIPEISGAPKPPQIPLRIERGKYVLKKSRKPLRGVKALGSLFRTTLSISKQFQHLNRSLEIAAHVTKAPDLVFGLLAAKGAVEDVRAILDTSHKTGGHNRTKATLNFILHVDTFVNTVATLCKIIRAAVGPTVEKAVQWIPIFNMISLAVSFVSLGLSSYSTHRARKLLDGFNGAMKECLEAEKQADKAMALAKALAIIEEEGIDPLRKQLMISKKARPEFIRRINDLRNHIYSPLPITEDDEKFVRLLVGRARTQMNLAVTSLAGNIAGVAGGVILLTPVPIAGQLVGLSILAATGVLSLAVWGTRYFLINKDPFDEKSRNRAMRMLSSLSSAIRALKQRLLTFGLVRQRLPNVAPAV